MNHESCCGPEAGEVPPHDHHSLCAVASKLEPLLKVRTKNIMETISSAETLYSQQII